MWFDSAGTWQFLAEFDLETKTDDTIVSYNTISISFLRHIWKRCTCFGVQFVIFENLKSPVKLNSLLSKFFCYITWFTISPD